MFKKKEKKKEVVEAVAKAEIDEIMQTKGMDRGVTFQTDAEFIKEHGGEKALHAVEEETKNMGYPIEYDKLKLYEWYPAGLRIISMLAVKKILKLDDKEIKQMGRDAVKRSIITRMMMKYFISVKTLASKVPAYWEKHLSEGCLEVVELNEDKKYIVLQLKDFKPHPILCTYLSGYFLTPMEMTTGSKTISEETKCMHRGDEYHEFIVRWGE